MNIKYKNKLYCSDDIPLFLYFKSEVNKREFVNILSNYQIGTFQQIYCVHAILAGSRIIKDKRTAIFMNIDDINEKKVLQKNLFDNPDDGINAMICSPGDIQEQVIQDWVENNIDKIV